MKSACILSTLSFSTVYCLLFLIKTGLNSDVERKVVTCYVSSWAVYRPGHGSFAIEKIDPNLCTHVIYAFAGLNTSNSTIRSLDPWQDLEVDYGKGGYKRTTSGLKKLNPQLKVLIAIGGWNEGSTHYSRMTSDPMKRQNFVDSVLKFIKKYDFDGLDLDWEYPGKRGGSSDDKEHFVSLVKDLRNAFSPHNYLLTAALGASFDTINVAYNIAKLSKYLDYLHIMCYDYHGTWDRRVGPNAPLYGTTKGDNLNVNATINYLRILNANPAKVVLGLPFYGRTFFSTKNSVTSEDLQTFSLPAGESGFPGLYTKENGFMGYNEICLELQGEHNWTRVWNKRTRTPFLFMGNKVISYDDEQSLREKVRYAKFAKLAGVMIWSIDTDDFSGRCSGSRGSNYPLLRLINEEIRSETKEYEDDEDEREQEEDSDEVKNINENDIDDGKQNTLDDESSTDSESGNPMDNTNDIDDGINGIGKNGSTLDDEFVNNTTKRGDKSGMISTLRSQNFGWLYTVLLFGMINSLI